jgi:Tol biopolymer transport system component
MGSSRTRLCLSALSVAVIGLLPAAPAVAAPTTERISVDSAGGQANNMSDSAALSADGRFAVFASPASNLVAGDTNGSWDVFVRDRQTNATTRVSVGNSGQQASVDAGVGTISADGRYVAFESYGGSLIPGVDLNGGNADIFVRDRQMGTTQMVSVNAAGQQGNQHNTNPTISADGRYVAFTSDSSNLVPGDTNGATDTFVRDRATGVTERVSVDSAGNQVGPNSSFPPSISPDGRYVAFSTSASDLVPGDTNGTVDVFVHDRQTGTTEAASVDSAGVLSDAFSYIANSLSISEGGRYVTFISSGTNLVPGDTNGTGDVFVHDRLTGTTERVSVSAAGDEGNGDSGGATITPDGRYVAFHSAASNLVAGDGNGAYDAYVRDRQTGTVERVNVDGAGNQATGGDTYSPVLTPDGQTVAFGSEATSLVPGDTNAARDIFVRGEALAVPDGDGDGDGDGVLDSIDVGAGQFDDGGGTTGSIVDTVGLPVTIADVAAPDGVKVTVGPGIGRATLRVCGGFVVRVSAGSEVLVTCGSVKVAVTHGSAEVVLGDGLTVVSVPSGVTARVYEQPGGRYQVENLGGGTVTVTIDGVATTVASGQTKSVTALDFVGFTSPVDNPAVMNVVKAGQAVPLKWRLLQAGGVPYTTLASATLTATSMACNLGSTADLLEEVAAGGSGLQNLGNGFYQLNWKTPKEYASSCKGLHLNLGEGVTRDAYFKFEK